MRTLAASQLSIIRGNDPTSCPRTCSSGTKAGALGLFSEAFRHEAILCCALEALAIRSDGLGRAGFALALCEREIARKDERRIEMTLKLARFPFVRDLLGFDFAAQFLCQKPRTRPNLVGVLRLIAAAED
jgi:hypothetical protein